VFHVFNHAITYSVLSSMWSGSWLLSSPVGKVLVHLLDLLVVLTSAPLVLFVLSKAFERILHDQMLEHVNGCNLLSDFQKWAKHRDCFGQRYRGLKVDEG
jgi:hypothetical protein